MAEPFDLTFCRNLVLTSLRYLPLTPDGKTLVHPDENNLWKIGRAVNVLRSRYFSWLFSVIWNIPEDDYKDCNRLASHVRCLHLSDKNEELLLSFSLLIQVPDYVVHTHRCFDLVDIAARCLRLVFVEKYQEGFDRVEFDRHVEATIASNCLIENTRFSEKDMFDMQVETYQNHTSVCKKLNDRSILDFYFYEEERSLLTQAQKEIPDVEVVTTKYRGFYRVQALPKRDKDGNLEKDNFMLFHLKYRKLECPRSEVRKGCPRSETEFCMGCYLTISYPEVKKEKPSAVRHCRPCRLQVDSKENNDGNVPEELERALSLVAIDELPWCATQISWLPYKVLGWIQYYLDLATGTDHLKRIRISTLRGMNLDILNCQTCRKQCMRKLNICMDLYAKECGEQLPEPSGQSSDA